MAFHLRDVRNGSLPSTDTMRSVTPFRILAYKAWERLRHFRLRGSLTALRSLFQQADCAGDDAQTGDMFDARWGVETSNPVPLYKLRINSRNDIHGVKYQASSPDLFHELMDAINIRREDFIFIDLGSGKGRVLLLASQLPFKKVIGIEFSRELTQIADANLKRWQHAASHIELLWMDVEDYNFPGEQSVVYLYNPFDDKVMARVLGNLRLSVLRHPRQIYIVYCNPLHASIIDGTGLFARIISRKGAVIYSNTLPSSQTTERTRWLARGA